MTGRGDLCWGTEGGIGTTYLQDLSFGPLFVLLIDAATAQGTYVIHDMCCGGCFGLLAFSLGETSFIVHSIVADPVVSVMLVIASALGNRLQFLALRLELLQSLVSILVATKLRSLQSKKKNINSVCSGSKFRFAGGGIGMEKSELQQQGKGLGATAAGNLAVFR